MVDINKENKHLIDFSIMPSLECNLECNFCMYNCGKDKTDILDIEKTKTFLDTIDWDKVNSMGFYGGEISINLDLYADFMALIPTHIQQFCITNGSWSTDIYSRGDFVLFASVHKLNVAISSTPEHKKFQDISIIDIITKHNNHFFVKHDDTKDRMLPMGRNCKEDWTCTKRCLSWNKPKRYALMPDGDIIFQSCDGVYPHVGTYNDKFSKIIKEGEKNDREHNVPCAQIQ